MKIAIISDTHDNTPAVVWIIKYLNENNIKVAFHAGDLINPGVIRRFKEHYQGHLHFIFGNNDGDTNSITSIAEKSENLTCYGREMELELEGKKVYMIHYSHLGEAMVQTDKYDLVIGGHDHEFRVRKYGEAMFVNPGNTVTYDEWIRDPKEKDNTFVILDLKTMGYQKITQL